MGAGTGSTTASHPVAAHSRCVVVCAPSPDGHPHPPDDLLAALRHRDVSISVCANVFDAMADLVEHERAMRRDGPREAIVLLIVEPADVPRWNELIEAAPRFTPHVVCWQYRAESSPELSALEPLAPPAPDPAAAPAVSIRNGIGQAVRPRPVAAAPKLRLTGHEQAPHIASETDEEAQAAAEAPLLTEEELAMLLGDDPDDEPRRGVET